MKKPRQESELFIWINIVSWLYTYIYEDRAGKLFKSSNGERLSEQQGKRYGNREKF